MEQLHGTKKQEFDMARTLAEIDTEISATKENLNNVKGTTCEVYSRIVGYYRSVANFNAGKAEEYKHRVMFDPNKGVAEHLAKVGA